MIRLMKRFLREKRGALSAELVIAVPLIAVAQAIAFDVGRVILDQHALEAGVRDAARYLARANISDCPGQGSAYWRNYNRLIAAGVQSQIVASDFTCNFNELYDGSGDVLTREFTRIEVVAQVRVSTPLTTFAAWGAWDGGITIAASDQARFIGE